jgi:hypothetical protein
MPAVVMQLLLLDTQAVGDPSLPSVAAQLGCASDVTVFRLMLSRAW